MVKVVFVSDIHNGYEQVDWPEGQLLIHAGDITKYGSSDEIKKFGKFAEEVLLKKYEKVITIAGNHDNIFERDSAKARRLLGKVIYLKDELTDTHGLKIYGTPWTRGLFKGNWWAFGAPEENMLKFHWSFIPEKVDILITHSPPRNILDEVQYPGFENEHAGSISLLTEIVNRIKPRVNVFGHIHEGYGTAKLEHLPETTFINASIMDIEYKPVNKPIVMDL